MPKYIFTYRRSHAADASPDRVEASSDSAPAAEAMAAWTAFFEAIGPSVVDPGQPVFQRTNVGEVGTSTVLGGYSIVEADNLDDALALAAQCPSVREGGGVEIGVLTELAADHPAEKLRHRASMQ
jgi:hypothetical protein